MGRLLWTALEYASLLSLGAALFAIIVLIVRRPGRWYWYVGVKTCLLITQGLLLYRVEQGADERVLPADPVTITYVSALTVLAICLCGVAFDITTAAGHRMGRGDPPPASVAQGLIEEERYGKP